MYKYAPFESISLFVGQGKFTCVICLKINLAQTQFEYIYTPREQLYVINVTGRVLYFTISNLSFFTSVY